MSDISAGERRIARNISMLKSTVAIFGTVLASMLLIIFVDASEEFAVYLLTSLLLWTLADYLLHLLQYNSLVQRRVNGLYRLIGKSGPFELRESSLNE